MFLKVHAHYRHELVYFSGDFQGQEGVRIMHQCALYNPKYGTLVMKFHDRQSSERCIRKLISRHCLDKTRTRWNDFLFLITDDHEWFSF